MTENLKIEFASGGPDGWRAYYVLPLGGSAMTDRTVSKTFDTWEDFARWAEDRHGITGWKRESRSGHYLPSLASNDVPCDVHTAVDEGRWTRFGRCDNRRKPGEEMCGMHLAHKRKAEEKAQAERERAERVEAAKAIASDAMEALKARGIDSRLEYKPYYSASNPGGYTGGVSIHAEDLLAMLRKLERAEAMLGAELEIEE